MKKIISLSLVAITLLSSCVSNSFKNQRYTKFGHASNTNKNANQKNVKEFQLVKESVSNNEVTENTKQENPLICSASPKVPQVAIKAQPKTLSLFNKINVETVKRSFTTFTEPALQKSDNQKTEVKSKKSFKEKVESAKRIIGTVLKIVLFSIILAIVVGIIILVLIT